VDTSEASASAHTLTPPSVATPLWEPNGQEAIPSRRLVVQSIVNPAVRPDEGIGSTSSATPFVTIPSAWRKPTTVCGHCTSVTCSSLGSMNERAPSPGD